jgi:hypothetical protein
MVSFARSTATETAMTGLHVSALACVLSLAATAGAQTLEDGIMLPKGSLFAGDMFTYETWDEYWEGTLRRSNGNIGTLTTRTNVIFGNYGISDRLNVIAMVPHVWTRASQGVLEGMEGFQDVTFGAKFTLVEKRSTPIGSLRAMAVGAGGVPLTNYTPDFYPLSIGSQSKRLLGRFTFITQAEPGWYVTGSTAYTWRSGVSLDRPYYFTDGQMFFTNQVDMPNVVDYSAGGGYMKGNFMTAISFGQQITLGGGDIRRQDMPFVSNRMNFTRVSGMVMTPIPKLRRLAFQVGYSYTVQGRNVGQAATWSTGLFYRFPFFERAVQ